MKFPDRISAGSTLALKLQKYKNTSSVVLGIPRGGIPVAYAVARELNLPLDVVLTKKIGHPMNKEYAIGAASLSDYFIVPHEHVSEEYIHEELKRVRDRLSAMYAGFIGDRTPVSPEGKTVIIVDDGIATGNTLLATIRLIRKNNPLKIVVAVPVAPASAVDKLKADVDELIVLYVPDEFFGVGAFYEDFSQVEDNDVIQYLKKSDLPH